MDEVRKQFLTSILNMLKYWHDQPNMSAFERMDGLAFSILTTLDGGTDLPGFVVAPCPHESDKEYYQKEGRNWYPEFPGVEVGCDIGGALHEYYSQMKKPVPERKP